MASLQDNRLVFDFMEKRRQAVISLQVSKGLKASGFSAGQLNTKQTGDLSELVDSSGYFEFQEFGRKAGKAPPWKKILDWVRLQKYGIATASQGTKGFNEKEQERMAWAIVMKIKRRGTYTYIKRTPTGVLTEAINEKLLHELISDLIKSKGAEVRTDILRIYNQ